MDALFAARTSNIAIDPVACALSCPADANDWTYAPCGANEQPNFTTCLCECIPDACGSNQTRANFANGCGCECIADSCGLNQARTSITDTPACGCVCDDTTCGPNQVKNPFPSCDCACTADACPGNQSRNPLPGCDCYCPNRDQMITDNALLGNNKVYDETDCSLYCPEYALWANQCGTNE